MHLGIAGRITLLDAEKIALLDTTCRLFFEGCEDCLLLYYMLYYTFGLYLRTLAFNIWQTSGQDGPGPTPASGGWGHFV